MLLNIPKDILADITLIHNALAENNHSCYLVGGCVRDHLLEKTPKDYDLATSASTKEVYEALCDKAELIPTGIEFGTWTIILNGNTYEITTFRSDMYDEDNVSHHPSHIKEVATIEEDLSRRDFAINAMAYDFINNEIKDPYGGREDLERKIIRCVGYPATRFTEDPLRMLRAIRFQAQLGFEISRLTKDAIWNCSELIKNISGERIQMELNKILLANPAVLETFSAITLLCEIMPELTVLRGIKQNNPWHIYNAFEHSIKATEIVEPELHLRLAMLLHDLGKYDTLLTDKNGIDHFYNHGIKSEELAKNILKRLRYSNDLINKVCLLVKEHDRRIALAKKSVKKVLNLMGEEATRDLLKIRWADICAQNPIYLKERAKKIFDLTDLLEEIIENQEPFSRKDLKINGKMLMDIGFEFGPDIGKTLDIILHYVQNNPELNTVSKLQEIAKRLLPMEKQIEIHNKNK